MNDVSTLWQLLADQVETPGLRQQPFAEGRMGDADQAERAFIGRLGAQVEGAVLMRETLPWAAVDGEAMMLLRGCGTGALSARHRAWTGPPSGRPDSAGRKAPGAASDLEVDGGVLAAVLLDLIGDLLAFVQAVQASPLDGADMDEHVLAAAVRLNEAKTLGGVEPLDRTCRHIRYLLRKSGAELRAVRNPAHLANEKSIPALLPWRIEEGR